ncbi:MAG TPA: DAK2 domain-containing protein [Jiangellales bacterium]|nr:DAK2 domain-containing protein [Jiangellales bacterium]
MPRAAGVLGPRTVRRWVTAARDHLADAREEIDALNVYPVPDGDTGTNLYLTLEAAAEAAETAEGGTPDVTRALARGALLGARGNSGVILSQMMRGMAEAFARAAEAAGGPPTPEQEPAMLAAALRRAAEAGYEAVAHPVEGTMLTVARATADAAEAAASRPDARVPDVALAAVRAAREAVERTPSQLDVLARSGVVDAGGRGLSVVLDAFDAVLTGRRAPQRPRERTPGRMAPVPAAALEHDLSADGPAYEVMYLLEADDDRVPALRATLDPLGDSLVVIGGDRLWNVHVHVDDVGAAIEAGIEAGRPYRVRVTHFADQRARRVGASRTDGRAVVAFAAGEGLADLFAEAGAVVVATPVGHRPSTAEVLDAVRRSGATEIVVLPNDRDGVPSAEAAAAEAAADGLRVAVIPTTVQIQGIAALAVHEPTRPFDADVVAMTSASAHVRHGAVTVASRAAVTSAGVCEPGDVLGVVEGDFAIIGSDLADVAVEVCRRILAAGGELLTVVSGLDAVPALAEEVTARVRREHQALDAVVLDGGQPRYPLLIGVE